MYLTKRNIYSCIANERIKLRLLEEKELKIKHVFVFSYRYHLLVFCTMYFLAKGFRNCSNSLLYQTYINFIFRFALSLHFNGILFRSKQILLEN